MPLGGRIDDLASIRTVLRGLSDISRIVSVWAAGPAFTVSLDRIARQRDLVLLRAFGTGTVVSLDPIEGLASGVNYAVTNSAVLFAWQDDQNSPPSLTSGWYVLALGDPLPQTIFPYALQPAAEQSGRVIWFKDTSGVAGSTINAAGADTFLETGLGALVLGPYGSALLYCNGAQWMQL